MAALADQLEESRRLSRIKAAAAIVQNCDGTINGARGRIDQNYQSELVATRNKWLATIEAEAREAGG